MNFHHSFQAERKNSAGFTLVEIIVMILVAAIILPALIIPFVEGVRDLGLPVVMTNLSLLAQGEMEKNIICLDYNTVSGWGSTAINGFPGYTSQCTISTLGVQTGVPTFGEVIDGIRLITVTVTYSDPGLDPDPSLSLTTVKTDWNPEPG